MRLEISNLNLEIDTEEDKLSVLVVEDVSIFTSLIADIKSKINGEIKEIYLSENFADVNFSRDVVLCTDIFNLNLNERKLLTAIYSQLEKIFITNENLQRYYIDILNKIDLLICDLNYECDFDLEWAKTLSLASIFKMMDVKNQIDDCDIFNNFINWLDLITKINNKSVIVTVNLFSFFSEEQINELCEFVLSRKIKIINIDNRICENSNNRIKNYIIDKDCCII